MKKCIVFLGEGPLYEHSLAVANTAQELAKKYGENPSKAFVAGLFHDVGGIIPVEKRIKVAEISGINLLPEELEAPMLIHQKKFRNF
ncbi:HD domain-containing protein [Lactococcus fujiensis]|uniref:HD domain-containing protein n=1 Tax=Lactococcus fujiensis TaxID=610251 RepID=UPI000AA09A7F|nr:HD domain-containing protein [Lactococcus fujiensis]